MKVSEQWLRDYVSSGRNVAQIAESLTTAGLEVDTIHEEALLPAGIRIGRIADTQPHPQNPALTVCRVDVGDSQLQNVVCGAPNVAVGLRAPVALPGAGLPNGTTIETAEIHGVASHGMLCSTAELGLDGSGDRLWALPDGAPVGEPIANYLELPDCILELDLTPNRGDCLSVRGVAREVAITEQSQLAPLAIDTVPATHNAARSVAIEAPEICAAYAARTVTLDADKPTPLWLSERLRRVGVRSLNLPVDVANYVMLDIGQPMHAFDADKLEGGITVRHAAPGETIVTLDAVELELSPTTLVIADAVGPAAIAGVIGGERTAVDADTRTVVLESACFSPSGVAGQGRRYKIHTDSLHRFERGVDPELYQPAIEYATRLLCDYAGGSPGPVSQAFGQSPLPADATIELDGAQIERILGQAIDPCFVESALGQLGIRFERLTDACWRASPPSWRFDLRIQADLIEEVARLYGYESLRADGASEASLPEAMHREVSSLDVGALLRARGYSEAITYSFVDPDLQRALTDGGLAIALDNPIADTMSVMRRTLWAGLIPAWLYNQRRQISNTRLYEIGLRFEPNERAEHGIDQIRSLAGIAAGAVEAPHWSAPRRAIDFYDVKGDLEALLASRLSQVVFERARHSALHPGRSARIRLGDRVIGWLGQLSPEISLDKKIKDIPYLFEVNFDILQDQSPIRYETISDQPAVSRDLAIVVAEQTTAAELISAAYSIDSALLHSVNVVDVFIGSDLDSGFKSVSLRLIFQDKTSTLSTADVDKLVDRVLAALATHCKARIRGR